MPADGRAAAFRQCVDTLQLGRVTGTARPARRFSSMPSTVIRSFDYRPEARELDVQFTTGRRYVYRDVPPEAAAALRGAFAKGRHFNAHIRGRYPFTECEREDG